MFPIVSIPNPSGWKGVNAVLTEVEVALRQHINAIVWPLASGSIAMRTMAIINRKKGINHGYLLKISCGLKEIVVDIEKLGRYDLDPDFTEQTLGGVQRTIQKLLTNHNNSSA